MYNLTTKSSKNEILVGIIVPSYNSVKTLPKTLQSIANLKNMMAEISFYCVLVDDCSVDNSLEVIQPYIEKGVVDYYQKNSVNQGVSISRNIGIELCKHTDFITFCDSDDEFALEKFDLLGCIESDFIFFDHELRENNQYQLVHHLDSFEEKKCVETDAFVHYLEKYLERPNKFHLFTSCWSKFFRTRILIENNIRFLPQMKVFEDIKFNFDFLQYAKQKHYIHRLLYIHYRPNLEEFKNSASMGGHCSVEESFSFYKALEPLNKMYSKLTNKDADHRLNHCLGAYSVITLVRSSLKINSFQTFLSVRNQIVTIFSKDVFKLAFAHYNPKLANGNSVLPFFIRHHFFTISLIYAHFLGIKRYSNRSR